MPNQQPAPQKPLIFYVVNIDVPVNPERKRIATHSTIFASTKRFFEFGLIRKHYTKSMSGWIKINSWKKDEALLARDPGIKTLTDKYTFNFINSQIEIYKDLLYPLLRLRHKDHEMLGFAANSYKSFNSEVKMGNKTRQPSKVVISMQTDIFDFNIIEQDKPLVDLADWLSGPEVL